MNRSKDCRGDDRRAGSAGEPLERGVRLELLIGRETIGVSIDGAGIHFRHADGSGTEGHLPWSVAIAMSLVRDDLPGLGPIEAA
jgi:hypothetical protein